MSTIIVFSIRLLIVPVPFPPIELLWHLCWKSIDHINIDLFLETLFSSTDRFVCSFASITISKFLWPSGYSWNHVVQLFQLLSYFFFRVLIYLVRPFVVSYAFKNYLVCFYQKKKKKSAESLIHIVLKL